MFIAARNVWVKSSTENKAHFTSNSLFPCKTKGMRSVSHNSMLQCANVIVLQQVLTLIKIQGEMWRTRVQVCTQNFSMGWRGD